MENGTLKGFNLGNSGCNPELRIAGRPNPEGVEFEMSCKEKYKIELRIDSPEDLWKDRSLVILIPSSMQ